MSRSDRGTLRVPPKRARAEVSVSILLDATERLAREVGFESTTTTMIAKAAGVSVGTLYRYFPSREALLTALIRRQWEEGTRIFAEELDRIRAPTLDEQVERVVELAFTMLTERLTALGQLKLGTDDFLQLDAQVIELAARPVEASLLRYREAVVVDDPRIASLIIVRSVVFLARIGVRDYPDLLEDGAYAREVSRMISGYVFRGARPPIA